MAALTGSHAPPSNPDRVGYSISEVVELTTVPASSIHHYRRAGLVPEPYRAAPNRFVYDDRHVVALHVIRSMRDRGSSLEAIQRALPLLIGNGPDPKAVDAAVDAYLRRCETEPGPELRLIDAAIDAFATRGYRDVSIAALCQRAGVAKGTFYAYYEGKDALFLQAAATVIERAIDNFATDVERGVEEDHWITFARHLRYGLPVLLELAKQSIQDSGATAQAAAGLFHGLAERLGRTVAGADPPAEGAAVIMLAVVEIFMALVEPAGVDDAATEAPGEPPAATGEPSGADGGTASTEVF